MARATGLEPATSSVTGKKNNSYFCCLTSGRHRLATSIRAQRAEHAARISFVAAFQQVTVGVQGGLDVLMPHERLDRLQIFPAGDEDRRIEVAKIVGDIFWL